jgi:type I restriction enzyme S subunit
MISDKWKKFNLAEIMEIFGGGTPKTTEEKFWNGTIPWISVVDFGGEKKYIFETEKNITQLGLENSSTRILKKGQIVFSARGTVGELAILGKDMAFNQSCYGLNAKNTTINEFLYYLLKNNTLQIKGKTHGAVFDTITRETFDHIDIYLPSIKTQHRITEILSALDDKIELNRQTNATLKSIAQAIFNEWFINFNFPGATGEMVESKLGMTPKEWRVSKLEEIINNYDRKRVPLSSRERETRKGVFPYYGAASILDYVDEYLFDGVYLLMGEDGTVINENGKPILQYVSGKFWVNNHTHVLQGKNPFSTEYILLLLNETDVKPIVTGAVQPKINQGNMNDLPVIIPDELTLLHFQDVISPLFVNILGNEKESLTLTGIREYLLPKLMNGEIQV